MTIKVSVPLVGRIYTKYMPQIIDVITGMTIKVSTPWWEDYTLNTCLR